jgi:hypothetical protein
MNRRRILILLIALAVLAAILGAAGRQVASPGAHRIAHQKPGWWDFR